MAKLEKSDIIKRAEVTEKPIKKVGDIIRTSNGYKLIGGYEGLHKAEGVIETIECCRNKTTVETADKIKSVTEITLRSELEFEHNQTELKHEIFEETTTKIIQETTTEIIDQAATEPIEENITNAENMPLLSSDELFNSFDNSNL